MIKKLYFILAFMVMANFAHAQFNGKIQYENLINGDKLWHGHVENARSASINLTFKGAGYGNDSELQAGMNMLISAMANEGAGEYGAAEFQKILRDKLINFQASSQLDNFQITLNYPNQYEEIALKLLMSFLQNPHYREPELSINKQQIINEIEQNHLDPEVIVQKLAFDYLFAHHQYANNAEGSVASLKNITTDEMLLSHLALFAQDNLTITMVSHHNLAQAAQIANNLVAILPKHAQLAQINDTGKYTPHQLTAITQKNSQPLPLTNIIFVQTAPKRTADNFYTAYIINDILGGSSLESILSQEIREKQGLTYGINSHISTMNHAALWWGATSTKTDQVKQMQSEITKIWGNIGNLITKTQLENAKKRIIGRYALGFTNYQKINNLMMNLKLDGLSADYFHEREALMNKVSLNDIKLFAKNAMNPDGLAFFMVGDFKNAE